MTVNKSVDDTLVFTARNCSPQIYSKNSPDGAGSSASDVSLEDKNLRDWDGFVKLFLDFGCEPGSWLCDSNVRDDSVVIGVKITNTTGSGQSESLLQWHPSSEAERMRLCGYSYRDPDRYFPDPRWRIPGRGVHELYELKIPQTICYGYQRSCEMGKNNGHC